MSLQDLPCNLQTSVNGEDVILKLIQNIDDGKPQDEHEIDKAALGTPTTYTDKAEASSKWDDKATRLLLHEYKIGKRLIKRRTIPTMKKMWELIADKLKQEGYTFTSKQVENRWKTLERRYKDVRDNNRKSGRANETCQYFSEMEEIFGQKRAISPLCLIGQADAIINNRAAASSESSRSSTPSERLQTEKDTLPLDEPEEEERQLTTAATAEAVVSSKTRPMTAAAVLKVVRDDLHARHEERKKEREERYRNRELSAERRHQEKLALFKEYLNFLKENKK